jgi:hypothetical protein
MNLRDRLVRATPCGYGSRYYFSYRSEGGFFSVKELILIVCERWANRFGNLPKKTALVFYERLAKKYCYGDSWRATLRALESWFSDAAQDEPVHPKEAHKKAQEYRFMCWDIAAKVQSETNKATGAYGLIDSVEGECKLCGKHTIYRICFYGPSTHHHPAYIHQNGFWGICRRPMCKALARTFPSICHSRSDFPAVKILKEITKNGDRTQHLREISGELARYASQTHKWGDNKRRGKASSRTG